MFNAVLTPTYFQSTVSTPDTTYQDAYYAYLYIFDANNRQKRKEFLNTVFQDPHVAVLFYKNCNPTEQEKALAFDSISNDIDSTYLFMKDCNPEEYRLEALNILLCDDDYAYITAKDCKLSYEEKKRIYDKYHNKYNMNEDIHEYFEYCQVFQEFISENEIECLIDMIFDHQDDNFAGVILKSTIKLSDYLKDKLESVFIIKKLKEEAE